VNDRISSSGSEAHQVVQELLPWFCTNTLSPEETALVQEHLRACTPCQADLAWQRSLQTADLHPREVLDVDQAFLRLKARLGPSQSGSRARLLMRLRGMLGPGASWIGWALAAQAGMIVVLALVLVEPASVLRLYHGLGAPAKARGNIVVVFRPDTTERELRQILRESGARIIDGPTAVDAFLLSVEAGGQEKAIRTLRRQHAVTLAEPLNHGENR
jgi:hypothetical protein